MISINFAAASTSACFAEMLTFPLDIVKTRLQVQGESSTNSSRGKSRGMFSMGAGIIREEGVFKLWQGVRPAMARHFVYTGGRFVLYDAIRERAFERNADGSFATWEIACSGLFAGIIAQVAACPMDLMKIQMQMEGQRVLRGEPPRFRSGLDVLRQTVRHYGVRALWSGCVPAVQRSALINMADLTTYNAVKQFLMTSAGLSDDYVVYGIASLCSTFAGCAAGNPADVVTTRIMYQPRDNNGVGKYYSSAIDCLSKTVRQEGITSLYKGCIPLYIRMAPWSAVFWFSFEEIRKLAGCRSF